MWRSDVTYIDYEAVAFSLCEAHARSEGWTIVPDRIWR